MAGLVSEAALDRAWERLNPEWLATESKREQFDAAFVAGAVWSSARLEAELAAASRALEPRTDDPSGTPSC